MSARIQAIATHTGMAGIFRLIAADSCEVVSLERVDGFLMAGADMPRLSHTTGLMTELRGLQLVSDRVNRARDMDELLTQSLAAFDECFGLHHSWCCFPDESGRRFVTIASRGYGSSGVGAEARVGQRLLGTVAVTRRLLRMSPEQRFNLELACPVELAERDHG